MNSISFGQYSHLFVVYKFLASWVNPYNDRLGNQRYDTMRCQILLAKLKSVAQKALLDNPWNTHEKWYRLNDVMKQFIPNET